MNEKVTNYKYTLVGPMGTLSCNLALTDRRYWRGDADLTSGDREYRIAATSLWFAVFRSLAG